MVTIHFRYMTSSPRLNQIGLYAGSDIIYINVLGKSIIVIDKYETAVELLEKRSGIYSSRFVSVMLPSFHQSVKSNM
jgi:hypothetical protein